MNIFALEQLKGVYRGKVRIFVWGTADDGINTNQNISERRHKYAAFLCALFVFMVCSGFSFDLRLPSDPLKLASAYGDTQATHPSVLHFDEPWNGYTFWIAYSPYPEADDSKENPHILASNDGVNWVLPSGFSNPLDDTPENYKFHVCYNSCLLYTSPSPRDCS